jgi:hypothetical protein
VVDLFVEFLSNIKVTDYTIPGATIEKICEMMDKLVDECLKPFGFVVVSSKEKLVCNLLNLSKLCKHLFSLIFVKINNHYYLGLGASESLSKSGSRIWTVAWDYALL